jgi:threonine dehydratase
VRSFKIRGAFNFFRKAIAEDAAASRFVCASAGNHSQGFAFACRHFGRHGVVFMPVTTPQQKIDKTKAFGGPFIEVRLIGDIFDECYAASEAYARREGAVMVPPFDHADIIEGQATVAAEIARQIPEGDTIDRIVIPVGGGGLSCGIVSYFEHDLPADAFVLCEPAGSPSLKESLVAGHRVKLNQVDNFVDGAAVAEPGALNFECLKRLRQEQVLLIDENAICATIIEMLNSEGIVLEPAGAMAISALGEMERSGMMGETVVAIVSGGNFDFERLPDVKERAMRYSGLKKYFVIRLPQRPGALRDFLNMLGPEDDIARFEYLKKSARNFGSVLIGIETGQATNFDALKERFDKSGLRYQDITDNEILSSLII